MIDAETMLGGFLATSENAKTGPKQLGSNVEPNSVPTLSELGVTKKESSSAQLLAKLKEEEPEKHAAVRS